MIAGAVMFVVGGLLYAGGRLGLPLGRLPGDIRITGQNFTCHLLAGSVDLALDHPYHCHQYRCPTA